MAFHTSACIAWGSTGRSPIQDLTSLGQAVTLSHEIEVICARTRSNVITIDTRGISRRTDKIRMRSRTQKTHKSIPVFYDRQNSFRGLTLIKRENKMHGRRCYDRTYPCSKGQFIENTRKHITSDLNIAGET